MVNERAERIVSLYGFALPSELLTLWSLARELSPQTPCGAFRSVLGVSLVGPFEVLDGALENNQPTLPWLLHWRYPLDPPEFFTAAVGDSDGLHWGYWFDEPGKPEFRVVSYYARDAYELADAGGTLFAALLGEA